MFPEADRSIVADPHATALLALRLGAGI